MQKVYKSKDYCCGCTACYSICPKNAIEMEADACGFLYPVINEKNCINCGLCINVCAFARKTKNKMFEKCYVAKHKNGDVINESRSGGVFTALTDYILNNGGIVYGASLEKNFVVKHIRAVNEKDRNKLRKSKYVQSDLENIFKQVLNDLKNEKYVLFSGTPCQCEGIKSFLLNQNISLDKFILCDIVCHSNASPGLFEKYLIYQEKKFGKKIKEYYFRDKSKFAWGEHVEKIVFNDGEVFYTDEYTNLFFTDDIRPSCFNCKYTSLYRTSDITLADAWGAEKVFPDFIDAKGASLILVNTDKGIKLLQYVSSDLLLFNIDIAAVMQPRLKEAEKKGENYKQFWYDYENIEFSKFLNKYSKNNYTLRKRLYRISFKILKLPLIFLKKAVKNLYDK